MTRELWSDYMAVIEILGELIDRTDDPETLALLDKALGLAQVLHTTAAEAVSDALTGRFRG